MNNLKQYEIPVFGLSDGKHTYSFDIDEELFAQYPESPTQTGQVKATVVLDKSETMLVLDFELEGSIRLECDRSLDEFDFPIKSNERYIYKFGKDAMIVSDDIEVLPFGVSSINLTQLLYEFVVVLIPYKKLHPRYKEEEEMIGEDDEQSFVLAYSDDAEWDDEDTDNQATDEESIDEPVDPRFAALLKLKNSNNDNK
ncbi:MAG: hypothetical protein RLZZ175_3017 [Bacteroidota bacterium]